jgi:hypothetical protein
MGRLVARTRRTVCPATLLAADGRGTCALVPPHLVKHRPFAGWQERHGREHWPDRFHQRHDYVSDLDGTPVAGCLASLRTEGDTDVRPVYAILASATHPGDGLRTHVRSHGRLFRHGDITRRSATARNAGDGPRTGAQLRGAAPAQGRVDLGPTSQLSVRPRARAGGDRRLADRAGRRTPNAPGLFVSGSHVRGSLERCRSNPSARASPTSGGRHELERSELGSGSASVRG